MLKSSGILRFQDVFEIKYAQMPDEPIEETAEDEASAVEDEEVNNDSDSIAGSAPPSDGEDSEEEREKRLKELQDQVQIY